MADRFVSTSGSGTAATFANPCALADALQNTNGVTINPGDNVWFRAGTYTNANTTGGKFTQSIAGTQSNLITYRAYPGERVILDAAGLSDTSPLMLVSGQWIIFRDLEFTDSDSVRPTCDSNLNTYNPTNLFTNHGGGASNIYYVNNIIHDCGQDGIDFFPDGNLYAYGNIIYYFGCNANQAHGFYYNQTIAGPDRAASQTIASNIVFDGKGYNIHGYGVNATHNRVTVKNNISFQAGRLLNNTPNGAELLCGIASGATGQPGTDVLIDSNNLYASDATGITFYIGYQLGNDTIRILNNYAVGGDMRFNNTLNRRVTMTGNFLQGNMFNEGVSGVPTAAQWPGNTFTDGGGRPASGNRVVVDPNLFEPGRANVAIYNWDHASTVNVDISSAVRVGDSYAVYWAPQFASKTACLTGTYAGGTLAFPMTAGVLGAMPNPTLAIMAQPPNTALPEFGAFIVQTTLRRN